MQYGYLPMSDLETGNLRTEHQLRDAIKVMQRFGQLPETGILDEATRGLMTRPRCSLPDVLPGQTHPEMERRRSRRFVKQGSRWRTTNLTWGIRSFPERIRDRTGRSEDISRSEIVREFSLATEVWGRVSRLRFTQLEESPGEADIIIDFKGGYHGDGYPFDGPGRTLAHAFYPGAGIGGDMHFDTDEPWVQHASVKRAYETISLFITAAHELGHALGLYHSDIPGSLMSPYLLTFPSQFDLPTDDTRAVQELYGMADDWLPPGERGDESSRPGWFDPSLTPSDHPLPPVSTDRPNTCDTAYDAISVIRREIYIFKGQYFWRVDGRGKPRPNYPAEIVQFWQMLPRNLSRVDAVYERSQDGNIVFFIGMRYYVCHGNNILVETGPLRRYGLPSDLERIDAAFVWGHNGRTYFFADTMYWRFEEEVGHVELDYPRDMAMWRGVPYQVDAAFKYNGTSYFFKGKVFYEFDDLRMRVTTRSPYLSGPFWLNCPANLENPYYPEVEGQVLSSSSASYNQRIVLVVLFIGLFMHCFCL